MVPRFFLFLLFLFLLALRRSPRFTELFPTFSLFSLSLSLSLSVSVWLVGFLNRYSCPSLQRILSQTIFKGNAISSDENETFDALPPLIDHLAALISSLTNEPFLTVSSWVKVVRFLIGQLTREIPSYIPS